MATKRLLGILKDANGIPLANTTIRFSSTSTRSVLNTVNTDYLTNSEGAYNFSVEYGVYTIQIKREDEINFRTVCANAYVYSDMPETLELLIKAQKHVQEIDETIIQEMLTILASANAAALSASDSADIASTKAAESSASASAAKTSADSSAASAGTSESHSIVSGQKALEAKNSADASAASAAASSTSANSANTSAQSALASKTTAEDQANLATDKAAAASLSEQNALASKQSAENSASIATTKAAEAVASRDSATASAASASSYRDAAETASSAANQSASTAVAKATEASNSAASAELSKNTATTKAAEASASSATAQGYKDTAVLKATEAAQSAVEAAQSAALAAGALIEAGSTDLSSGIYPTPIKDAQGNNRSCFWKVTVGGSISGEVYGVGDSLVYSKELAGYYKIDNTESVTSVNGKQGVVVLNKSDVGLANADNTSDLNKPISTATQSSLDLKVDKVTTINSKSLSGSIVLTSADVGATPSSHVGSGGASHATVTTSVDGFMSKADKSKLDAIAVSANNYVHPASGVSPGTYKAVTVDGNGHVTGGSNPTTLGGFGITDGLKSEPNDGLSAYTYSGLFKLTAANENAPSGAGIGDHVLNAHWDVNAATQIYLPYADDSSFAWRRKIGGSYQPWKRIYHEGYKPTAADVGALPTTGGTLTGPVQSERLLAIKNGSTIYSDSQIEARSTDGSDVRIGFHRAGYSAGAINHNSWGFQFERESGGGSRANVAAANFFADAAQDGSDNALTRLDYVRSKTTAFGLGTTTPVSRQNWDTVLQPTGWYEYNGDAGDAGGPNTYGEIHSITSGNAGAYDGWAKQVFYGTSGDVFHRTSKTGGFSGKPWYKFWDSNNFNPDSKLSNNGSGGTLYLSNWFRSTGASGWHNETYHGGIYMDEASTVKVFNGKKFGVYNTDFDSIYSAGGVYSKRNVHVDARTLVGDGGSYDAWRYADAPLHVGFGGLNTGSFAPIVGSSNYTNGNGYTTRVHFGVSTPGATGWSNAVIVVGSAENNAHPLASYSFGADGHMTGLSAISLSGNANIGNDMTCAYAYATGVQQTVAHALTRKDYVDAQCFNSRWDNRQVIQHGGGDANAHYNSAWDGASVANAPSADWHFFRELYHSGGANWRHQEAFNFFSDEEWFRRGAGDAGSYGPWRRRWHSGNANVNVYSGAIVSGGVRVTEAGTYLVVVKDPSSATLYSTIIYWDNELSYGPTIPTASIVSVYILADGYIRVSASQSTQIVRVNKLF